VNSDHKEHDLRRVKETDLVAALADPDEGLRHAAFREICARGEKRGWEAFGLLTQDTVLAGQFLSLKTPFNAIGIAVGPDTYARVKERWPFGVEGSGPDGRLDFGIDFRNQRLGVMTIAPGSWPPGEKYPAGHEGFSEVEFRVKDVSAFARRVESLAGDLKSRLVLLSGDPAAPENGMALLAHVRAPRGARTLLVKIRQD